MSAAAKKRAMLIGRSGVGKTTLCQYQNHEALRYHKTQTITLMNGGAMIDTPGEYLEIRNLQRALFVTSADAHLLLLVQAATENGTMFPPSFSQAFNKPALGIVTKIDLASPDQVAQAEKLLRAAGAREVYPISAVTGEGVPALSDALEEFGRSGGGI